MQNNQSFIRKASALVLGLLVLAGASSAALAKEKQTVKAGMGACKQWCDKNRTGIQRTECYKGCERYWACNGSDSTVALCKGVTGSLDAAVDQGTGGQNNPGPTPRKPAGITKAPQNTAR